MAENKSSFILYADLIHTVRKLPKDKAGELFLTILEYVNDLNPVVDDIMIDLVFEPIKQKLKRDLRDWEAIKTVRSQTGRLGGIQSGITRKAQKEANEASASKRKQKEANEAVNVTVTVTDTVNVIKEDKSSKDFKLAFDSFIEMRKKIKKPATDRAIELVKKQLSELAPNNEAHQILILEQSIRNGWQDVFKLRNGQSVSSNVAKFVP